MEVSGLVGLDSISSLHQDSDLLSARSNSSVGSMEDALGGHVAGKKKSNTLSRLRKLKKQVPPDLQQKVDGLLPSQSLSDIKDLTGPPLEKRVNGNVMEVQEWVAETDQSLASRVQDGREGISSMWPREGEALLKNPSPSPRVKPRRIRPLDGPLDDPVSPGDPDGMKGDLSAFDSLIGPPPLARPPRLASLDDASDLSASHVGDTVANIKGGETRHTSNGFSRHERRPSPRVKPRRFGDLEERTVGNDARTISTEYTEKRSAVTEEWSIVQEGHKTKDIGGFSMPVSSKNAPNYDNDEHLHVSEKETSNRQKGFKVNSAPRSLSIEEEIVPHSSEVVCSEPTLDQVASAKERTEAIAENIEDEDPHLDDDLDAGDLIVIPDNSPIGTIKTTKEHLLSNLTETAGRTSGDGQSDLVDEATSSLSSLTDVSKLMSPLSSSTPTRAPGERNSHVKVKTRCSPTVLSSDDDDDIVVSTFAHRDSLMVEDTIIPTENLREESVFKRVSSAELVAELENLSDDDTLKEHSVPVAAGISEALLQENSDDDDQDNEQPSIVRQTENHSVESGNQTKLDNHAVGHGSTPHILETPPPTSSDSASHMRDDLDHSVAQSEPLLGGTCASQFLDTNRSFMSTGALSTITTRTARNRSYLSGGVSRTGSMLSKDELERFFPDQKVKIFIATWNMCEGKVLPDNLEELLLPEDCVLVQDMYVIGTQESSSDGQEWEVRLQETLGPSHVLLHSATHGVLRLLIFIRRDLIWFCSVVEDDTVSTRAFSMIKTKGAVAASFTFFGTSFLFINSHFTAGDEQIKERIADYDKIIKDLQLPSKVPPTRKYNNLNNDITSRFDYIFWCGDFNFRLVESRTKIESWAGKLRDGKDDNYEILLQHDQLRKNMTKKSIFRGFHEGQIQFLPTYKYDIGGDVYDTSAKARVPSYTDRVLFKSRTSAQIHNVLYNACNSIKVSDHKPVYAMFEVKIRPGKDDSLTSGGVFSREVFNEANKRRVAKATMSETMMSQKSSTVCSVM